MVFMEKREGDEASLGSTKDLLSYPVTRDRWLGEIGTLELEVEVEVGVRFETKACYSFRPVAATASI